MIAPSRKKKICDVLTSVYFNDEDDVVEVVDGQANDLYLRVISPKFEGMRPIQMNRLVWKILFDKLPQSDWGEITMTIAFTPEEAAQSEELQH